MPKSKGLMDHVSKAQSKTPAETSLGARIDAVNALLYEPAHSSVNTGSATLHNDTVKARISEHNEYPSHHPAAMRSEGKSIRFYNQYTNLPELMKFLNFYIKTYTIHVAAGHTEEGGGRQRMIRYLDKYPLGIEQPPFTDVTYYKNANSMSKVIAENAALATGTPAAPVPEPVRTDFAENHAELQKKIYLCLRANYHRFMDGPSKLIMDGIIARHERSNNLSGEDRLTIGKRYSWDQMKSDMVKMCCIATPGGYYFLPLYTTIRQDGTPVQKWVSKVLDLYRTLQHEDTDWGKLAEGDASQRAFAFISPKELTVIEQFLMQHNKTKWDRCKHNTLEYFRKEGFAKTVELIVSIQPEKFPGKYIAKVHSPWALRSSLYTWTQMQNIVTSHDVEKDNLIERL